MAERLDPVHEHPNHLDGRDAEEGDEEEEANHVQLLMGSGNLR